ncbi:MAG: chemotaxis protein CheW, partial [Brevinematales bacterium]
MEKQYVSFEIANSKYCVDVNDIKEVVREENITTLPNAPSFVEGLTNLRGVVVPVISIRKKLGIKQAEISSEIEEQAGHRQAKKLMIVNIDGVLVAFAVDSLDKVFPV